jgi:hypothetical protein
MCPWMTETAVIKAHGRDSLPAKSLEASLKPTFSHRRGRFLGTASTLGYGCNGALAECRWPWTCEARDEAEQSQIST